MSEDVIAHEMCTTVVKQDGVGGKSKTQLPKWLDEGLALQLDHRFVHRQYSTCIDYKAELAILYE
jgi:hypothetical protein